MSKEFLRYYLVYTQTNIYINWSSKVFKISFQFWNNKINEKLNIILICVILVQSEIIKRCCCWLIRIEIIVDILIVADFRFILSPFEKEIHYKELHEKINGYKNVFVGISSKKSLFQLIKAQQELKLREEQSKETFIKVREICK